ncbi:AcrR family transcriptional regulator [Friedmanniella endophytica]|uniref:AcrR family transcriptional regulator n=1 Tax=Microlunatus kandeliicorticis TaxID=1759536 RepID=A0A7W3ISF2_9ACTN|nr:TetR/AcrR family transcriptional regulator [Microlunatus kandeliicorticis]MBA8794407.1 AcrR family transcriptional regulator [Microlunatus kandeliicorticis]
MTDGSIHRTARDIAREEITRAIVAAGRRQLSEVGPSELSLRAVARELGMVSSAVYRYFPSRDELLTALVVVIYTEIADELERTDAAARRRPDLHARWIALAHRLRDWAREHPFDYALVYGSPIPGYTAPRDTVAPATRVVQVLLDLLAEAEAADRVPEPRPVPRAVRASMRGLREATAGRISDDLLVRGVQAWGSLLGALDLELFGHLHGAVEDHDVWFAHLAERIAPL